MDMKRQVILILLSAVMVSLGYIGAARAQIVASAEQDRFENVQPGERLSGTISLSNTGAEPASALIIFTDRMTEDPKVRGGYEYRQYDGKHPAHDRSLIPWFDLPVFEVKLDPGESMEFPYYVEVPDDPSLVGTYWGQINVRNTSGTEVSAGEVDHENEEGVGVTMRTFVSFTTQVYVTLADPPQPDIRFTGLEAQLNEKGRQIVVAYLTNDSPTTVGAAKVWVELRDETGQTVYKSKPKSKGILPASEHFAGFDLADAEVEPGSYLLLAVCDAGKPQLIAAQATINITATADDTEADAEAEAEAEADAAAEAEGEPEV
jgi:hypothetical protein